jgi:tetratricopeptide (TPR) repeat protein
LLDNVNAKVEQYYQGLPMKETTPAPLARKARFYQNNASVLHDEGRLKEAETNALAALAIFLSQQERLPLEPAWPAALADVYATLVKVHSNLGDLAAALAEGNAEVKCAETRRRLEPGSQPATAQLAEARFDLGNVLLKMNRIAEAAVQIDQGVALLESYSSTVTNGPDRSTLLATGRYFQGLVQLKRQDLAGATSLFGQYQATFKELAATDPANGSLAREWMVAESRLGDTFFNINDWDQAFGHFSQSYELARRLFEHDPTNLNHQKDAASNLEWLAETLMRRQAPEAEILDYGKRAYEALKSLAERQPEDKVLGDLAAKSLVNYTRWLNDHGHREMSDQIVEREIADGWNFVKLAGGVTGHHRRFIEAVDFQDTALYFRGQNERRVEILQTWLAKTAAALPGGGITGGWCWTIGQLHAKLADACFRLGRFDDSLKELRLALPLRVAFATAEPQDDEVRNAVVESFRGLRNLSNRLGDVRGALAFARQFLDWSRTSGSALAAPEKVRPRVVEVCLEAAAKAEGSKQRQDGGKLLADCLAGVFAGDTNLTEGEAKLRARLAGEMTRLTAAQAPP